MSDDSIKWERLAGDGGPTLVRTSVPGGWLVASGTGDNAPLVFVPDEDQEWGFWEEDDYDADED